MRAVRWLAAVLPILFVVAPAPAQTMSPPPGILGTLPSGVPPQPAAQASFEVDAPRIFLLAARQDLAAGRADAVRDALEHVETLVLTRSVLRSRPQQPSDQALVATLDAARTALADADRSSVLQIIDTALRSPDLDEPPH
jgi:hypothetical protein